MLAVTMIYGLQVSLIPLLTQEAGLSLDIDSLLLSQDLLQGLILTTCVLSPSQSASDGGWLQAGIKVGVLTSGVTTVVVGMPAIGLASLCLREILYFGIAYKVEAALALLTFGVGATSIGGSEATIQPVLHLLTSLSLGVLVFGKFLEPLREDWSMNDSEFLSENRLD